MFTSKNYRDIFYVNGYSVQIVWSVHTFIIVYTNDKNKPSKTYHINGMDRLPRAIREANNIINKIEKGDIKK